MRILRVLPLLLAVGVIWALNHSFGALPAIGKIVDPVNGAMAAAEDVNEDWNRNLHLKDLAAPVAVWLDTSLIPHIRAGNDHDLYYAQGYIHASFRLWQMDLQTRAAWGRVSEVAGPKAIDFDRGMRREGMVWGAQHSLETMERDPRTKAMLDAYRDGINAYIHTLIHSSASPSPLGGEAGRGVAWPGGAPYRRLPIEYKLMGFVPEDWTNLRTALLMKYMARDLTGKTDDIAYTQLRDQLGQEQFDFLFPERIKGSKPVIPEGTKWDAPSIKVPDAPAGDVFSHFGNDGGRSGLIDKGNDVKDAPGKAVAAAIKAFDGSAKVIDKLSTTSSGVSTASSGVSRASSPLSTALSPLSMALPGVSMASSPLSMASSLVSRASSRPSIALFDNEMLYGGFKAASASSGNVISGFANSDGEGAESGIGSNNWAISGAHTASGKPILCNDPHLALNLPSLWYEMQLTAPGINAYGASLPGAPGIVIGFNEQISWGFTNNYRDVKDFYEITPRSLSEAEALRSTAANNASTSLSDRGVKPTVYVFAGKELPFQRSIEVIKVKDGPDVIDTVLYTIHGPVTYDPSFPDPAKSGKLLACTWMAHRGSNELLATYLLNRAGDYPAFTDAISHFECPAQNIAYADGAGNIAMWAQGRFINKWKDQGKYVMKGTDSSTLWGAPIPMAENPHVLNPPQGYVASANQQVTDSTYPYWYNQSFTEWRSWEINKKLNELKRPCPPLVYPISPSARAPIGIAISYAPMPRADCQDSDKKVSYLFASTLQNDEWSRLLEQVIPKLVHYANRSASYPDTEYAAFLSEESNGTFYQTNWFFLMRDIWQDEFPTATKYPSSELTVQLLLSDFTSKYYDDKRTQQLETLREIVQRAFKETTDSLEKLKRSTGLEWYKVKNTSLTHLAKIPAFSYDHLKIGGWSNTINAATGNHGPSWRMIVEMDSIPRAYAIYPGGQSGNPGSRHYSDFIQQWVEGKYHAIQFLNAATTKNPLKYTWTLTP